MKNLEVAILLLLVVHQAKGRANYEVSKDTMQRSFTLGNKVFLKDGSPYRIYSGAIHFFRVVPERWDYVLMMFKNAGLNTIDTYVPWGFHQRSGPKDFDFSGRLNLTRFLSLAQSHGLDVILRVGPFIDAEVDFGGLPIWLITENSKIRTLDPAYMRRVKDWVMFLGKMFKDFLYHNGGPVIMVQVENEYGGVGCDKTYLQKLEEIFKVAFPGVILSTCDPIYTFACGNGRNSTSLFATVNIGTFHPFKDRFLSAFENYQDGKPVLITEFYTGWFSKYGKKRESLSLSVFSTLFEHLLERGYSINLYMFMGGTNYDFMGGTVIFDYKVTTSYDFDAPLDQSGLPNEKFEYIKLTLGKYNPNTQNYGNEEKEYPTVVEYGRKKVVYTILASRLFENLTVDTVANISSTYPLEYLSKYNGFTLYRSFLPKFDGSRALSIRKTKDDVVAIVNSSDIRMKYKYGSYRAILDETYSGSSINILHLMFGHQSFTRSVEFKYLGEVFLGNEEIANWNVSMINVNMLPIILKELGPHLSDLTMKDDSRTVVEQPIVSSVSFTINSKVHDTYLDLRPCFNTGYAYMNGHNLGYYNNVLPPQRTLYVPAEFLQPGQNELIIFEYYYIKWNKPVSECTVALIDHPVWVDMA